MIRLTFKTSAGEHTVVATVPCINGPCYVTIRDNNAVTYGTETGGKMANDIVIKVSRLEQLCFEKIVPEMTS